MHSKLHRKRKERKKQKRKKRESQKRTCKISKSKFQESTAQQNSNLKVKHKAHINLHYNLHLKMPILKKNQNQNLFTTAKKIDKIAIKCIVVSFFFNESHF